MARFVIMFMVVVSNMRVYAQEVQQINLLQAYQKGALLTYNRSVQAAENAALPAVQVSEGSNEGLIRIKGATFSRGAIEVDLKGQDVLQRSFLGIAFHIADDSTYDAVYFRPFNFRAADSVRRIHAVQYISHPQYTWKRLRDERNAQFEKSVTPVPDPNGWFHARIEVGENDVKVFVNNAASPSLHITKLNNRTFGDIALWTGDSSGGSFANLVLRPDK